MNRTIFISLFFGVLSVPATLDAAKYSDYSADSYEICIGGGIGNKMGSQILTCFNREAEGHGFIFTTIPKKNIKKKPMVCHARTSYKITDGEIEIRAHKGSCPSSWWTKFHKFQCNNIGRSHLDCENSERSFELVQFKNET